MIIKNYKRLASSKGRKIALDIVEAGLQAIRTDRVIRNNVKLNGNKLMIKNKIYNLKKYKRIFIVGGGKASCLMAREIEKILENKITKGLVIDIVGKKLKKIKVVKGTHPVTTKKNVDATKKVFEITKGARKDDLVICLISGGASALFAYPAVSVKEIIRINQKLLKSGMTINEVNTVRKHLSRIGGGNLAKWVYPAKLVSIIFSDVVGDDLSVIASGPTVMDKCSIEEDRAIIRKYKLGRIKVFKTTRDPKYFKNVDNILLLNNKVGLDAMIKEARKSGLRVKNMGTRIIGEARNVGKRLANKPGNKIAYLGAGETTVTVRGKGKGGRNQELALGAINNVKGVLISIGSDGGDNSDAAGAIVDSNSKTKAKKLGLDTKKYLDNNDSYNFFKKMKDQIITGPTGTNVADLIVYVKVS